MSEASNIEMFRGRPPAGWDCRPSPTPPSCFSELYRLNQCYDDVKAMQKILTKVMTDLIQSDPSIVQTIIEEISKSGSSVPQIGVTDGTDAQAGQVGEYVEFNISGNVPQSTVWSPQSVVAGIMQPGDWDVWGNIGVQAQMMGVAIQLSPAPAGFSNTLDAYMALPDPLSATVIMQTARASLTVPTLLAFNLQTVSTSAATFGLQIAARRRR
jgi:hypothetical protein